jgi:ubiquinone/menaquinone biosynthesis C-methylase UbiE
MQEYWTQPATYDPIEFDTRFRPELLDVWLPHFVRLADLAAAQRVLDLGCGTGGFALAIAQHTQAHVIGVDVAPHLLRYAVTRSRALPILWVLGHAEALPLAHQTVDWVLMSLILHQIADRERAIQEVYRVLRPGGCCLVRTVAPEVTLQDWVPFRFFPQVAAIEAARLPAIADILTMYTQAGFHTLHTHTVERNARVDLHKVREELQQRKRPSYKLLSEAELANGLRTIEQEWHAKGGHWIDPKPHILITGVK